MHARLASYNIRKSVGLDYRRDPARVMQVVTNIGADIIALQEVDRRVGRRRSTLPPEMLIEHGFSAVNLAVRPDSIGWHGNAILLRNNTVVTRKERIDLPGVEPRGAVIVDVATRHGALRIVGAHLALLKRHRAAQTAHISAYLAKLPELPTAVMGDFNDWSRSGKNLNGFGPKLKLHQFGDSFPALYPVAGLDRMATSDGIELLDGGVHRCKAARRASDHLPIWADIKLIKS